MRDPDRLKQISRYARLERTTGDILAGTHDFHRPVLDGTYGRLVWAIAWVARGQFIPQAWRDRVREIRSRRRPGDNARGGSVQRGR